MKFHCFHCRYKSALKANRDRHQNKCEARPPTITLDQLTDLTNQYIEAIRLQFNVPDLSSETEFFTMFVDEIRKSFMDHPQFPRLEISGNVDRSLFLKDGKITVRYTTEKKTLRFGHFQGGIPL